MPVINHSDDEWYTSYSEIEKEMMVHKNFFRDKIIYCNCDDSNWSNFWKFFYANFERFGLKKLIGTSYHPTLKRYKYVYEGGYGQTEFVENDYLEGTVITELNGNGNCFSEECRAILTESDIVITNPPFSLFKEYIKMLVDSNKYFIVVGNMNALTYKETFNYIYNNNIWLGYYTGPKDFTNPYDDEIHQMNTEWYTNIPHNRRFNPIMFMEKYDESKYQKYDNYDAIECSRVKNIPCDYTGKIGVPISFLKDYCPSQFELIGMMSGAKGEHLINGNDKRPKFYVNGKGVYARAIIKWKPEAMPIIENGVISYESKDLYKRQ